MAYFDNTCAKLVVYHRVSKSINHFYYTCKVEEKINEQDLDDYEKDLDFVLKFVPIDEAIQANTVFKNENKFLEQMAEREKRVLEILKAQG